MVYKGTYKRLPNVNGFEVAIKTIKSTQATDDFLKEMRVMSKLIHPNIVRFHGIVHRIGNLIIIIHLYIENSILQVILLLTHNN